MLWFRTLSLGSRHGALSCKCVIQALEQRHAVRFQLLVRKIGGQPAAEDDADAFHFGWLMLAVAQIDCVNKLSHPTECGRLQPKGVQHGLKRTLTWPVSELGVGHIECNFIGFGVERIAHLGTRAYEPADEPDTCQSVHMGPWSRHPSLVLVFCQGARARARSWDPHGTQLSLNPSKPCRERGR